MIILILQSDLDAENGKFKPGNIINGWLSDTKCEYHQVYFRVIREATKEEYIKQCAEESPDHVIDLNYDEPLYFFEVLMDSFLIRY